ncbi:YciK family oxidoreductase [Pseudomonas sp. Marseille-QA0892]
MFDYIAPADLLNDRVILVTGAGRGIGAAAAIAFAEHGAEVILLGRTAANLEEVARRIEANGRARPMVNVMDLEHAGADDYRDLVQTIEQRHGRLDGVLHNASILGPRKRVEDTPVEAFAQVMAINVNATYALARATLPLLQRSSSASVVFTSSSVGRKGRAEWGSYAISKFATEGLMQVLADEYLAVEIRFNSVNPGGTRTAMRAEAYPNEDPNTRPAPESIMPIYLYLMGRDSAEISGQAFDAQ